MDPATVRLAVPGDGMAMSRLNAELMVPPGPDGYFIYPLSPAKAERWLASARTALAECRGEVVGMAACSCHDEFLDNDEGRGYGWGGPPLPGLEKLGVLPGFRRRGIAMSMLSLAYGGEEVLSSVITGPTANEASLAWHRAAGFSEAARYSRGDGYSTVLLRGTPRA